MIESFVRRAASPPPLHAAPEPASRHSLVVVRELRLGAGVTGIARDALPMSPRLLLVRGGAVEVRAGGPGARRSLLDAATALLLDPRAAWPLELSTTAAASVTVLGCAGVEGASFRGAVRLSAKALLAYAALRGGDALPLARATGALSPRADEPPPSPLPAGRGRGAELAHDVRAAIAADPSRRHALADLARSADVSPFHLAHVFSRETGISVHQHLVQLRLALAVHRLRTARSLGALAFDLGFSSHSHFSSSFGRWFGVTPASVRASL